MNNCPGCGGLLPSKTLTNGSRIIDLDRVTLIRGRFYCVPVTVYPAMVRKMISENCSITGERSPDVVLH